jgi:hypothetical protein
MLDISFSVLMGNGWSPIQGNALGFMGIQPMLGLYAK